MTTYLHLPKATLGQTTGNSISKISASSAGDIRPCLFAVAKTLFLTFLCLIPVQQVFAARVLTLSGDPWPPFVEGELGSQAVGGIAIDITNQLFDRVDDLQPSFPLVPWKRALQEVENGRKDGIVMLLKNAKREKYMAFSDPVLQATGKIWYSDNQYPKGLAGENCADLNPLRLAVTRGYSYGEDFDQAISKGLLSVVEAPSVENLFAMLSSNRVGAVLANDVVGYALAARYPDANIRSANFCGVTEVFYLGLSRKSGAAEYIPAINQALSEIKKEGVINRLLSRPTDR